MDTPTPDPDPEAVWPIVIDTLVAGAFMAALYYAFDVVAELLLR